MFIEKLTKKDIVSIIKEVMNFDGEISSIRKTDKEIIVRYMGIWYAHEITISDFSVNANINAIDETKVEHQNKFKAFMLNKFGDKYKQAFNEKLKQKYESEMIK